MQVCNACGQVGYVPENYVQFLCAQQEGASQLDSVISMAPPTGMEAGASNKGQFHQQFSSITQLDLFQLRVLLTSQVSRSRRGDALFVQLFVSH